MLSIIIPTKNEENYLPLLLDSIKSQNYSDLEIIVADSSRDKTREIAKDYGCKIVEGGLPAKARNNGAKYSKGEILVFIDSDVILPNGFLDKALKEFYEKKFDVAGTLQFPISTNKKIKDLNYKIMYEFMNQWMLLMQKIKPYMQVCMFSKKEFHEKIGGFNENIIYAEDSEYAKRAGKVGKFGILKSERVLVSPRRFEKEGFPFTLKCLYLNVLRFFGHEFKEGSRIKYFED